MRIFYIQRASIIDWYIRRQQGHVLRGSYQSTLDGLTEFGFATLFGVDPKKMFLSVPSSFILQNKWAEENGLSYRGKNWRSEILAAQIESFRPDVVYTSDNILLDKRMKKFLPASDLYAVWNASPINTKTDLSHFDLGLSFNCVYRNQLRRTGVKKVEHNSFYIDPRIKTKLDHMNLSKDIDVSFVGRYAPMFRERNQFLHDVYSAFRKDYNIQYHLLMAKRFKGLLPSVPWALLAACNKPVFLEDMFKVFKRSRIVLNAHSNLTGDHKGNMRVFEALGSGSFLLTDHGKYPEYLVDGCDFVSYKSREDMIDKIRYFLVNREERVEIARNGYKKVSDFYNTEIGSDKLVEIFGKYL